MADQDEPTTPQLPSLERIAEVAVEQLEALVTLPTTVLATVTEFRDAARAVRRVAGRIDAVLDDVEGPLRAAAPALNKAAALVDDPLLTDALRALRETERRVTSMATSTDRLASLLDETGGRLAALPGAAALFMRRTTRPAALDAPAAPDAAPDADPGEPTADA